MSGLIGSLLLLLGVIAMTTLVVASRRRLPPAWLIEGRAGELVPLAAIGLLVVGFGYTLHFVATLASQSVVTLQAALLLATPVSAWGTWRLLASNRAFHALLEQPSAVVPFPRPAGTPPREPTTPRHPETRLQRAA